jgi:hypothetical protein
MLDLFRPAALAVTIAVMAPSAAIISSAPLWAQAKPDPAPQSAAQTAPALKQMALTEKQLEAVLASQKEMDAITDKIPDGIDKPDPKVQAELDAVASKHGFASYAEYSDVVDNISLVLSGIDPKTKAFLQPSEVLKKQIAEIEADTKMPAKDKKAALDDMTAALKTTPTVQFADNIKLVTKYYEKLSAALQQDQ